LFKIGHHLKAFLNKSESIAAHHADLASHTHKGAVLTSAKRESGRVHD
jgi:hypothetical protein